jgi:hypothetical protein
MDMKDIVACMEADESDYEDEYEEDLHDSTHDVNLETDEIIEEEDMELDEDETERERKLSLVPVDKIKSSYEKLKDFFGPEFIRQVTTAFNIRVAELNQQDLPYWNL